MTTRTEITDLAYEISATWQLPKYAGTNLTEALMKLHLKGLTIEEIKDVTNDIMQIVHRSY